jgi:dihydrofolate reductase
MFNRVSIDGFFAGPNGEIDWFIPDSELDKAVHELMSPDTVLFGRVTYELLASYWPMAELNPNASEGERAMANEQTK